MGPGQPRRRLDHFNPLMVAFASLLKIVCQVDLWFVRHLKPEFSNCIAEYAHSRTVSRVVDKRMSRGSGTANANGSGYLSARLFFNATLISNLSKAARISTTALSSPKNSCPLFAILDSAQNTPSPTPNLQECPKPARQSPLAARLANTSRENQ
jgi:hypothetical protein